MARIPHPALENRHRWQAVRRAVFKRDGYRCTSCGKAGKLECDHRVPIFLGGDWWDIEGLQSLCRGCHINKTRAERVVPNPERDAWKRIVEELGR